MTAIQHQSTKRRSFLEALLARQQRRTPYRENKTSAQRVLNPINHVPRPLRVQIERTHLPPSTQPGTGEVHTLLTLPEQRRSRQYSPTSDIVEHSPQFSSAGGSRTSIGLPPNQKRTSLSQTHLPQAMAESEKGPAVPEKSYAPTSRYNMVSRDLESQQAAQPPSILGSDYGLNPLDQPSQPPRRVASQKSLRHFQSTNSLRSSIYKADNKDNRPATSSEAPPPIPPKFESRPGTHNDDQHPAGGEDEEAAEELAWGPSHPCFPHLNPHVPLSSREYHTTRVIRIKRDWMVVGDLAPTFSNIYPEILDPLISEQEFRFIIQHINSTLVQAFDPFHSSNWLDGILGFVTGWFWEDFRPGGVKGQLRELEAWIQEWNTGVGSSEGVKIISPRRTGYMNLDFQVPDPQIRVVERDDVDRERR